MAKYAFVLGLLALLQLVFCAQTPIERFINSSFEPDVSVSTEEITGGYFVVSAGGEETYVVSSSGEVVKDKASLSGILVNDIKEEGGFSTKVSSAKSLAGEITAAKSEDEAKCMQYLGLTIHNCTDRDSCIVACYASPQCSMIIQAGGFIEAMVEWNAGRQEFDSLISSYSDGIGAIETDSSAVEQKISVLDDMESLAEELSESPLSRNRTDEGCSDTNLSARCFEYCPKIDYSISKIAQQKENLASIKSILLDVARQPSRADAILANGKENDDYLSTRESRWNEFRLTMSGDITNLKSKSSSLLEMVDDEEVGALLASLSNFSANITADVDAGYYRRALSKKQEWEKRAGDLLERMNSEIASYENAMGEVKLLEESIEKSRQIIGNESAESYSEELARIKANITPPAKLSDISSAKTAISELKAKLTTEIATKAMEQPSAEEPQPSAQLQMPSIPCLPALLIGMLFIFILSKVFL